MTKEKRKKENKFFFLQLIAIGMWKLSVDFITTIDLICNVILDHIKNF